MHVRELVDVAALVALNGPLLVASQRPPAVSSLEQYWSTSKCRFDSWNRALKSYAPVASGPMHADTDRWIEFRAALDEIFISEMLTRVWSAVLVASDRSPGAKTSEPIARSVLTTHMEARRRALGLLLQGGPVTTQQAVAINRLRRRSERWTDVLLGGLWQLGNVREFAIEPDRADDFAIDLAERRGRPEASQAWRLTLVSLHNAFQVGLAPVAANPEANARITASILGCFPAELFDSTGLFHSLWMVRMSANTSDAQGLISELLDATLPPSPPTPARPKRRI